MFIEPGVTCLLGITSVSSIISKWLDKKLSLGWKKGNSSLKPSINLRRFKGIKLYLSRDCRFIIILPKWGFFLYKSYIFAFSFCLQYRDFNLSNV